MVRDDLPVNDTEGARNHTVEAQKGILELISEIGRAHV